MTLHGIAMGDQPFEYIVPTESEAGKVWRIYTHIEPWKCTCPGHLKHHHCKHIQMVQEYLAEMEGGREPEEGGRSCSWRERNDHSPSLYTERTSKVDCEDPRSRDYPISWSLAMAHEHRQDPHVPLRYLSVVAVVIRGKIVELHQYVGEIMGDPTNHEASRNVKGRAEAIRDAVEAKACELQLDVRAGMFEP